MDVLGCGERVGTFALAEDLTDGELSLVSASLPWSAPKVEDDMWGWIVSDSAFKMNFLFFRFK